MSQSAVDILTVLRRRIHDADLAIETHIATRAAILERAARNNCIVERQSAIDALERELVGLETDRIIALAYAIRAQRRGGR